MVGQVLHVDDPLLHDGSQPLHVVPLHVEACLKGDAPTAVHHRGELLDEAAPQAWLAAAEGHAAACGEEIEVVGANHLKQLLCGQFPPHAVAAQAAFVEAVLAPQCASVEGRQGGDAFSVDGQAVPRHGDEWCPLHGVTAFGS